MLNSLDETLQKYKFQGSVLLQNSGIILLINEKIVYPIASISKMITATIVLSVLRDCKIPLEDKVNKYIENIPDDITIEDLLTHRSGLALYTDFTKDDDDEKRKKAISDKEFFDRIMPDKPNKRIFQYNNANYIVLEKLITKITGQSFITLLGHYIIEPCNLKDTGIINSTQTDDGYFAVGHRANGKVASSMHYSWVGAGAGIHSTVEDLLSFSRKLLSGKLLSQELLENMFTPRENNYGLGINISEINGQKVIYHEGSTVGFSSFFITNLETKTTLILLSNYERKNMEELAREAFSKVIEHGSWRDKCEFTPSKTLSRRSYFSSQWSPTL